MSNVTFDSGLETAQFGTIHLLMRSTIDGLLWQAAGSNGSMRLSIEAGKLLYQASDKASHSNLDAEDCGPLTDGQMHSVALVVSDHGTKLYVDGYQTFCGTSTIFFASLGESISFEQGDQVGEIRSLTIEPRIWSDLEVLGAAPMPTPLVQFAANRLSDYDTESVSEVSSGTFVARFRVRGFGQGGTLLAAAGNGVEQLRFVLESDCFRYEVAGRRDQWRTYTASGEWADGNWHYAAIRVGFGAVDIYVDGYRQVHAPGSGFFADVAGLNLVTVGQDTGGSRFFGEASWAAIYPVPLNDAQLKRLANAEPLETFALFDRGYKGSVSYRIPSLVRTACGTLIAGADQRTSIANDSPNHINFVIRRSQDEGHTWSDLQEVIHSYGGGISGSSVIDSCPVVDSEVNRVVVLMDYYPGEVGQPNNQVGVGLDSYGRRYLYDKDDNQYVLTEEGEVVTEDGQSTPWTVDPSGAIKRAGIDAGNINAAVSAGHDLHMLPTCYLVEVHTDDEGETWSEPRLISHQVKEPWMHFCGTGPGSGIQLKHGKHAGRLLIPIYYQGDYVARFSAAVIYSDDHGVTWKRGESPNDGRVIDGEVINSRTQNRDDASLHEATLVERSDGTVLMLMRNQHPHGCVLQAISKDGAETWGDISDSELPEIFSQPNAISLNDAGKVLFCNASQLMPYRGNGVLRMSMDDGQTWPWHRTINPGHHVYQSMTMLDNGDIGLLWENETQGLYFTRLPAAWFK